MMHCCVVFYKKRICIGIYYSLFKRKALGKSLLNVTLISTISHHDPQSQLGRNLPSMLHPLVLLIRQILVHMDVLSLRQVRQPSAARVRPKNVEISVSSRLPHIREDSPFSFPFPFFHNHFE
jgi:hypothetical protein